MERLISLFREPDYENWSPSEPGPAAGQREALPDEEPLYFKQLLAYLRERREGRERKEETASEQPELIGA